MVECNMYLRVFISDSTLKSVPGEVSADTAGTALKGLRMLGHWPMYPLNNIGEH